MFIFNSLFSARETVANLENLQGIIYVCIVFSVIYTLVTYSLGLLYKFSLELVSGQKVNLSVLLGVYTKSNLYKYLPGNVMQFVSRNMFAKKLGLSHANMALGSFLEVLMVVAVSVALCIFFVRELFLSIMEDIVTFEIYVFFFVGFVILMSIGYFIVKKTHIHNKLQLELLNQLGAITPAKLTGFALKSIIVVSIVHILAGLMFSFLVQGVSSVEDVNVYFVSSAYIVAWLIGFITPGSPGGIGVKETVLLLTLTDFIGSEYILICALLFRLVTVTSDVFAFCFHTIYMRLAR